MTSSSLTSSLTVHEGLSGLSRCQLAFVNVFETLVMSAPSFSDWKSNYPNLINMLENTQNGEVALPGYITALEMCIC